MPKYLSALATSSIVGKSDTEGTTINSVLLKQNAVSADSVHTNSLKLASGASSDLWLKCTSSDGDATWTTLPNSFTIAVPTGIAYVATNGNDSTGTGAISAPFATIQRAFSAVAGFTNAIIRVAPGSYQSDNVPMYVDNRNVVFLAEGAVEFAIDGTANVCVYTAALCTRGTFTFTGCNAKCGWSMYCLALSGQLEANLSNLTCTNIIVSTTDSCKVHLKDSTIDQTYVVSPTTTYMDIDNVKHTGNATMGKLGLVTNSQFQGSLTAASFADISEISPRGFFNCDIRGALTMSGNTAYMDNATYRALQSNGGSIGANTQVSIVDAAMTDQIIVDISASPYTIAATTQDAVFVMDTSTANGVIYLPPLSTSTGRVIQIRNTGSKTLCINTSASASADRIWNTLTSVNLRADSSLSLRAGPASQNSWITV